MFIVLLLIFDHGANLYTSFIPILEEKNMNKKPHMGLLIMLLMFPQVVETIYSPVLPHLVDYFGISMASASQTLSIYFVAFAFGVVVWGRMADIIGRRNTMLLGLVIYGLGSLLAISAQHFSVILIARVMSAFGAAVGSVVTQTMLRDSYDGKELGKVFSLMGMGISISPVLGLMSGGVLAQYSGHFAVFSLLLLLAVILFGVSLFTLPETKPELTQPTSFVSVLTAMSKDCGIWKSAILVACFNIMMFSYYSLAPFIFDKLAMTSMEFGYSGGVLAVASAIGSVINRYLLSKAIKFDKLVLFAVLFSIIGSVGVYLLQDGLWFLIPMMLVVIGFGMAIPNILSTALVNYKHQAGTAGAILGLFYYLMIGTGLGIAGMIGNLGVVLIMTSLLAGVMVCRK